MGDIVLTDFFTNLGMGLAAAGAYGLLGIVLTLLGYRLFSFVVPFDLTKELAKDNNTAVGIVTGCVIIGVSLIVASAIT